MRATFRPNERCATPGVSAYRKSISSAAAYASSASSAASAPGSNRLSRKRFSAYDVNAAAHASGRFATTSRATEG